MNQKIYLFVILSLGLINLGLFWLIRHNLTQITPPSPSPIVTANRPVVQQASRLTTITLRAVGDIMLGRAVNIQSQKHHDFTWPFQKTILPAVDFYIGNLENPLVSNCPPKSDGMIFCAPPEAVTGLTFAKIDLVSLANNHTFNYGSKGLVETETILDQNNIKHLAHKQSILTTIQNIPIRFVAYDDLTYPLTKQDIATYPEITIAYIHWGAEYQPIPGSRQKLVASWLLERGTDIILGSHPHVTQPILKPQPNQLIAYSLGNFIFDQMWSEPTRQGVILDLKLDIENQQIEAIHFTQHFTKIYDYGQPRIE